MVVPCISVKYLIYLNINKIKLFVKFPVLCSCSGPWVGSEVAKPGCWRQPFAPGLYGPLWSEGFLWLSPCQGEAAVSSESLTILGPSASRGPAVSSKICFFDSCYALDLDPCGCLSSALTPSHPSYQDLVSSGTSHTPPFTIVRALE